MTTDNVSAAQTLLNIAQVSQQLITATTGYAKGVENTPNTHIQLEGQLQHIVAVSNLALEVVNGSSSLSNGPDIDPCLVEWLFSDEPGTCLATLKAMENLLKPQPLQLPFAPEDKIQEAITLFNLHGAKFHFLLTPDIWNQGNEVIQGRTPGTEGRFNDNKTDGQDNKQDQRHVDSNTMQDVEGQQKVTRYRTFSNDGGAKDIQPNQSEGGAGMTTTGNELGPERKKEVDPKEVDEFLRWLDGLDCTLQHEATLALRQVDTCTWLPETDVYQSWSRGDISFVWLEGKAGSGKSVLASSVIDGLEHARNDGEAPAFFYCDLGNERSTNAAEVMRSLIAQLLRLQGVDGVDCLEAVSELVDHKAEGAGPPDDMNLLTRLVCRAAQKLKQPLIVIDALDECEDVEKLANAVKQLNDGHIRLFVTSRPERIIRETLSDLPSISLQNMSDAVWADMARHITIELDSRQWLTTLKSDFEEEIYYALLLGADGMFRWVQYQIDTLAECMSAGEIRERLNSFPTGLDDTYERMLLKIDGNEMERTFVQRTLVWLVAALEPLELSVIMEALKIDLVRRTLDDDMVPTENVLLDALGSLVTHDIETGIVSLTHSSVKDYLTGEVVDAQPPQCYVGSQEDAHEQLARLCMCYMSLFDSESVENKHSSSHLIDNTVIFSEEEEPSADEEASFDVSPPSHSLLRYALSWGCHHLAHLGRDHDLVLDDMEALQVNIRHHPQKWETISTIFSRDDAIMFDDHLQHWFDLKHDFMLYNLVRFASVSLLERYLDRAPPMPEDGTNPLVYTAQYNKAQHAQILLSHGWQAQKSRASSSSSFLDQPAILVAEPSRNDEMDRFWDSQPDILHTGPHRNEQPSSQPRRVFNKVKVAFTNFFARKPAVSAQTNPGRETVEAVEVAAGKDKVFWIVFERIVWTPVNTLLFMLFYCRKPGPQDSGGFAPVNRDTRANSSRTRAGNAARNQTARPETAGGVENAAVGPDSLPTPAGNSVIRTQPERTAPIGLSGTENLGAGRDASPTSPGNSEIRNKPESIEMVVIRPSPISETSTVSGYASPQYTPSKGLLSPVVAA
ncbi:hypothetical protein PAXINDRAFT_15228, partial [Paxillus involutus ATCC 200175]